jgi:hypothetical protein
MPKNMKVERVAAGRLAGMVLLVAIMLAIGGVASARQNGDAVTFSVTMQEASEGVDNPLVGKLLGPWAPVGAGSRQVVQVTDLSSELYVVDLPSMGVHPIEGTPPRSYRPDGGAVGIGGAFMSVSPEVVSQTIPAGFGAASANWMPNEMVAVSLNGGAPSNFMASSTGRLGQIFNVGAGLGYITIEARGLTSGRQTGGVVEVRDAAPPVPGLAIAPHAINPNGSSNINVLGTRYAPGNVTLARNGTVINTLTAGASGSFYFQINVAASADTSAIYSTYTTTVGSRAGQSVEERADAGVPPIGDQNVARAFVDRPVVATAGGTVALVGEGFSPGETVTVSGCGSLSATADANGAVRFFNGVSGSGTFQCVLSGGTTGRVGRASGIVAGNVTNAPGIINAPAAVLGTGTFTLVIDRLLPNQSGTVYIDNVSQGNLSTDSTGKAAALINKPSSGFLHIVEWAGVSGQRVGAPLLYLPAGGTPTVTRTPTRTPTNTATNTAVIPTHTPTNTPTNTAVIPTQTPGGATATPVPSDTPTTIPTETSTDTPTTVATVATTATPCPLSFTDVPVGSTFYTFVRCLACLGIVNGYPDGTFKPNNNVTRGQLAKIVSNSAGFVDPAGAQIFEDVPTGSTFYDFVQRLASRGFMSGYPCGGAEEPCVPPDNRPYFRPNRNATRGQISKIVSNAAGFVDPAGAQIFEDVPPGSTFFDFVQRLASRGYMNGYPCGGAGEPCVPPENHPYFRPNNNATRGQTSKIVSNTFFPGCDPPRVRK